MTWLLRALGIACVAAASGGQVAAPAGMASVSGVIIDAATRAPIAGARVELLPVVRGPGARSTQSDVEGRFTLQSLSSGSFFIGAAKAPYAPAFYQEVKPGEPGMAIALEERTQLSGVVIALTPGGVITGQVLDPFGYPAQGVEVVALRADINELRVPRVSHQPSEHSTDDQGRYRLFGLGPGVYRVVVRPYSDVVRLHAADGPVATVSAMYFPGTADHSQAQLITLTAGEERTSVDVRLRLDRLVSISGIIDGPPDLLPTAHVQLLPVKNPRWDSMPYVERKSNRFVAEQVPPGEYWLTARAETVPDAVAASDKPVPRDAIATFWASAPVTVRGDANISDLVLTFAPTSKLRGRVVVEAAAGAAPSSVVRTHRVALEPLPDTPRMFGWAADDVHSLGADGQFTVNHLIPGRYRVRVEDVQTGLDVPVASIEVGGVALNEPVVTVPANGGLADVVIRVRRGSTASSGAR